jgi:DNA invertase Pin-like site-specific DNA recombinase
MIAAAKKHTFDVILVWKYSRFARNREDSILYKALLGRCGVDVISVNEQVDQTPSGKLLEGIIESIDEFYSSNLAQDTLRGMKENAGRGFRNGGNVPIGYKAKRTKDGGNERTTLEPDEARAPLVKHMFELFVQGLGTKEIAKQLNREGYSTATGKPWNKSSVHYVLTNEVYTGPRSLTGTRSRAFSGC